MPGLHCYGGFSPAAVSRGCSLVVVHGFSLLWLLLCRAQALERGGFRGLLLGSGAQVQELWRTGLVVSRHVGSSHTKDQPCALAGGLFTTEPPRKPHSIYTCLHLLIRNSESIPPHPLSLGCKWYPMVLVFLFLTEGSANLDAWLGNKIQAVNLLLPNHFFSSHWGLEFDFAVLYWQFTLSCRLLDYLVIFTVLFFFFFANTVWQVKTLPSRLDLEGQFPSLQSVKCRNFCNSLEVVAFSGAVQVH